MDTQPPAAPASVASDSSGMSTLAANLAVTPAPVPVLYYTVMRCTGRFDMLLA